MKKLLLSLFTALSGMAPAVAQLPVPFFVTQACPASANAPSVLRQLGLGNTLSTVGTITLAGTPIIVNGLGTDDADMANLYAMSVSTDGGIGALLTPPTLYRISRNTAVATAIGAVTPPPSPTATFPNIGASFVISQAADGATASRYFTVGASLRYNILTNTVSNVQLYLGEINLAALSSPVTPTWRLVNTTSDAPTAAVITNLTNQANAFLAGTGPLPDGGFQDIVYLPANNTIVSYLGVEQRFVRVSSPGGSPVATTVTPATPIPNSGVNGQVGSMYRDGNGNLFAMVSRTGRVSQIDPVTGNYSGTNYVTGLGCSLGDAALAPPIIVLPVTLTRFRAEPVAGTVRLAWQTVAEDHLARFVVERAGDDQKWVPITTVAARGLVAGSTYEATDEVPVTTARRYRLAAIDLDGTMAYSEAVEVRFKDRPTLMQPYPNPTKGNFDVLLDAPVHQAGTLTLVNMAGQIVWEHLLTPNTRRVEVPAPHAGLYQLVVRFDGRQEVQRIVVQP